MTRSYFDDAFIAEAKERTSMVSLVGKHVTLKRISGSLYRGLCPFHREKTPSFTIDEQRGYAHCYGCTWHGDVIQWLRKASGLEFFEAVEYLAVQAGMIADHEGRIRPKAPTIYTTPTREEDEQKKRERIEAARRVWSESRPADGTIVETYLASRKLNLKAYGMCVPPTLRFHPGLYHKESQKTFPAMVAAMQSGDRKISCVHRTFLKPDGSGKADVLKSKKMLGSAEGCAIRLGAAESTIGLAEGIETALSVMVSTGMTVWVGGTLQFMERIVLPPIVHEVVLCVDADCSQSLTQASINRASAFYRVRGCRVCVASPPTGFDFNDLLQKAG